MALAVLASFALHAPSAEAQNDCAPFWQPGGNVPGVDGTVRAILSMPNGDIIVGGAFSAAGGVTANRIARWNGTEWSALGSGVAGGQPTFVRALALMPNGDVIASGRFASAGGVPATNIARWNGTTWSALGSGIGGSLPVTDAVYALAVLPNGNLIAGGSFQIAGGVAAWNVSSWNGTNWSIMPNVRLDSTVTALVVLPNGDLIAGGLFLNGGRISRWNGSGWSNMAGGMNNAVSALAVLSNGDVVAAGSFTTAGGVPANRIARWNGTAWAALGTGFVGGGSLVVTALAIAANGDVLAGGNFTTAGDVTATSVARWNGVAWSAIPISGSGIAIPRQTGAVYTLAARASGEFFAGGDFLQLEGIRSLGVSRWNLTTWLELGEVGQTPNLGMNGKVAALLKLPNGDLITGGAFTTAAGVPANSIARWNGFTWFPLGVGTNGVVNALALMPNGDLVAAGRFTAAGDNPAINIARWNGTSWSALAAGLSGNGINALLVMPNGDLIAGGSVFASGTITATIARWNGTTWSPLGTGLGLTGGVNTLAVLPEGSLIAGGSFSGSVPAPSAVRLWNGAAWSNLGATFTGSVNSLVVLPNGNLIAAGGFSLFGSSPMIGGIARWNGTAWLAIIAPEGSNNGVRSLAALPNGDFVASGGFSLIGGIPVANIARFNGAGWSALGTGLNATGLTMLVAPNGELVVGGEFLTAGGQFSPYLSRYNFGCPPCSLADVAGQAGPSADGVVDGTDFIAFISSFSTGSRLLDPVADVAGAGPAGDRPDGIIDGSDFIAFINAFAAGC